MELVSRAKETLHDVAERAAGYQLGQTALRYLDHTLWVVESCSKWAVPPPLDQDERAQPELVRPLPWVFFLMMLVALRVTRESISLLNLVMGKPPLRSADVVMYVQGKRRYVRTLQYQGARALRARSSPSYLPWHRALGSLLHFTMCFRRHTNSAAEDTATITDSDQVLVVKRSKRVRENSSPVVTANESTMERLIEKMMVDLDADSDSDSSYTLTTLGPKSGRSEVSVESDRNRCRKDAQATRREQEPVPTAQNTQVLPTTQNNKQNAQVPPSAHNNTQNAQVESSAQNAQVSANAQNNTQNAQVPPSARHSTQNTQAPQSAHNNTQNAQVPPNAQNNSQNAQVPTTAQNNTQNAQVLPTTEKEMQVSKENITELSSPEENGDTPSSSDNNGFGNDFVGCQADPTVLSIKEETQTFLQAEASSKIPRTSNNEKKIVNGRTKSFSSKKKGQLKEKDRRNSERVARNTSPHKSF